MIRSSPSAADPAAFAPSAPRSASRPVADGHGVGASGLRFRDPRLEPIAEKVDRGERLTIDDGRTLLRTHDLWTVCALADRVRRRLHGDRAYYNINRHLNYSNVCALSCKFCEFYRKDGDAGAYTRDLEYVKQQAREAVEAGATEIHSVGGLHPKLPFSYYTDLCSTIRETARSMGSDLHVKAFTAVEIVHLAKIARVYKVDDRADGIRHVLTKLHEAGLGSLPGGGAEVFDDRVHDEAFKGKIRSDVWLDVHRVAHELGLNTNATILYGHIESPDDRLVHMDMLRRAQDRALARLGYAGVSAPTDDRTARASTPGHLGYAGDEGADVPVITLLGRPTIREGDSSKADAVREILGSAAPTPGRGPAGGDRSGNPSVRSGYFQTIIPLPFFPDGSELEHLPGPAGLENLRTLAVARLMLDNFPHVKAFWIMQTLPMAQLMLQNGADDLDGTIVWYDITKLNHGAGQGGSGDGVRTHQEVNVWTLHKAIREAGFTPVERDTVYRRVVRDQADGRRWRVE